jgi:hypothetical protein
MLKVQRVDYASRYPSGFWACGYERHPLDPDRGPQLTPDYACHNDDNPAKPYTPIPM